MSTDDTHEGGLDAKSRFIAWIHQQQAELAIQAARVPTFESDLRDLIDEIEGWLKRADVPCRRAAVTISEPVGTYTAPSLEIPALIKISVEPKAFWIAAPTFDKQYVSGRVDIKYGNTPTHHIFRYGEGKTVQWALCVTMPLSRRPLLQVLTEERFWGALCDLVDA